MKQSYVAFTIVGVAMLINFFGAFFTIKRLRDRYKMAEPQMSSGASRDTDVYDLPSFADASLLAFAWKLVARAVSDLRGTIRARHD
jgi:hypothetical protein